MAALARSTPNVTYVRVDRRRGAAHARRLAMDMCRPDELVAWLDGDGDEFAHAGANPGAFAPKFAEWARRRAARGHPTNK